ncbi:MAG: nitroreductase family deazaflavin-dependent oxidoreductase [Rubrobacteraceae bacterium]
MSARPRGRPYSRPIQAAQRAATNLHSFVYRVTNGKAGGRLAGGPVLLLTTTGRKSGRERTVPLLYLPDGENLVIVGSNGGTATHPAWWLNLRSNPEATVEIEGRKTRVRAEEAGRAEKERLWPSLVEMYGGYEGYRRRTDREIPVVILRPLNS